MSNFSHAKKFRAMLQLATPLQLKGFNEMESCRKSSQSYVSAISANALATGLSDLISPGRALANVPELV
jgi:hypothetical protein